MERRVAPTSLEAAGANGSWLRLPPPTVREAGAAFDRARNRLLVFGRPDRQDVTTELWALNLGASATWSLLTTTGALPTAVTSFSLICDPATDQLLLFGGSDGSGTVLNDVWTLALDSSPLTWTHLSPSGTPPAPRVYASAALDTLNDLVIVYGGGGTQAPGGGPPEDFLDDVWTLSLAGSPAWTQLSPGGSAPSARAASQMIWDGSLQRLVVFGGYDGTMLNDLYALSLSGSPAWSSLVATGGPPPERAVAATIWDPVGARMLIYAGASGDGQDMLADLWTLSLGGSPAWTQLTPGGGTPTAREMPAGAYDSNDRAFVMYGANIGNGETARDIAWSLNLDGPPEWSQLGGMAIGRRNRGGGIFDPIRRQLVVCGGEWNSNFFGDVWTYDLVGNWTELSPVGGSPAARAGHSVIYDRVRDRLLMFAGNDDADAYNDVWALSLSGTSTWTQIATAGGPPSERSGHVAVYDSRRDRMVIQGGNGISTYDTWALNLGTNVWTQIDAGIGGPGGSSNNAAVYDLLHDRMVVFGSSPDPTVWALDFPGPSTWTVLSVAGTPPPGCFGMAAAYDTVANAMLLFGGSPAGGGPPDSSTTALLLRGSPTWMPLDLGTEMPSGRQSAVAGYDPAQGMLYITGGCCERTDTWRATFDRTTPVQSSLVSASAGPDHVDVTWWVHGAMSNIEIQRNGGSGWTRAGMRNTDGTGMLTFRDTDVVAGHRYGYRLLLAAPDGVTPASEVWVDVPARVHLALGGFRPNPAHGEAHVALELGSAAPAWLEVLDVAGRRVFVQDVGGLGPGLHVLPVRVAASGVYLLRLTQAGTAVTRKATLMRR
jgi:hypothetical protein